MLTMPADEEAGSKRGSQASGRSGSRVSPEIVSEDASNQGEADPEEGLDLVIEEPDLDPHEDPDEELLQQKHDGTDYDEAPAEEPEEDQASEAHHRKRASFRGEQAAVCISRPWLASVLYLPHCCVGNPAALMRCCPCAFVGPHQTSAFAGKHWQRTVRLQLDEESPEPECKSTKLDSHRSARSSARESKQITFIGEGTKDGHMTARSKTGHMTARSKTQDGHMTARSKTELTEAEEDGEEGEDEDLQFQFVACGAMHTMLVTEQGRMLLAVHVSPVLLSCRETWSRYRMCARIWTHCWLALAAPFFRPCHTCMYADARRATHDVSADRTHRASRR